MDGRKGPALISSKGILNKIPENLSSQTSPRRFPPQMLALPGNTPSGTTLQDHYKASKLWAQDKYSSFKKNYHIIPL
jgi:hypothetical protein